MKTTTGNFWSFKTLAHGVMIAFAVASLGNVRAFLMGGGHDEGVAWALGLALGTGLVVVSIMLSQIDRNTDSSAFNWLLGTGIVLGLVSGGVQAAEYAKHLHIAWAIVLGFSVPLGGEVLLAVGVAFYERAKERERFRNTAATIERAVADRVENAIGTMEPTVIQKHVERTVNGLARLAVDSVATQAAQFYVKTDAKPYTPPHEDDVTPSKSTPVAPEMDGTNGETDAPGIEKANAARRTKAYIRQQEVLKILAEEYNGKPASELNKTEIGTRLDTTRQTIGRDIDDLIESGRLSINGVVKVVS